MVVALMLLDVSAAGECLNVTAISLFSKRLIDVTFTPLTMLIPTEPYRDDALDRLFAKLIGLKFIPLSLATKSNEMAFIIAKDYVSKLSCCN